MKLLTKEWLNENNACPDGIVWFEGQKNKEISEVAKALVKDEYYDWAVWLTVRVISDKSKVKYAVFAAENVIDIYEKVYPEDYRPRRAIEAAQACINDPSDQNKNAAEASAAACAKASAAACAEASAAACAEASAATCNAACAARNEMKTKIINYGIELYLEEQKELFNESH